MFTNSQTAPYPYPDHMTDACTQMSEDDALDPGPTTTAIAGGGAADYFSPYPDQVLENVLENVLVFLTSRRDRNAVSLVCKSWYRAEAFTRSELFIGNCYSISPRRVTDRFKRVESVLLKGKPRFADFNLLPQNWGAYFTNWGYALADAYRTLGKMYLKRMWVTDDNLALVARSFPYFKELVLVCCEGFGTTGLAVIASECRQLRVLELIEDDVDGDEADVDWISCFPQGQTCLESLMFDCVDCTINFKALESLVARSPFLKKLRVNRSVSIGQLYRLIIRAPQLTQLGTGSFSNGDIVAEGDQELDYASAFAACKSIVCLSGFRDILMDHLPAIYPVCANLTSLNFSYANIDSAQLTPVIRHCHKLQILWVLDSICDEGLQVVAEACKDLRGLRVFPVNFMEINDGPVSDVGLLAIAEGCRKLESILYFCQQMTNSAVIAMSKNCPNLKVFRLCIIARYRTDRITGEPMDEGFGAIVKNCRKLTRLSISGLLTDKAFSYIGQYGKLIRTLSVAFNGESDLGLKYVLEGCPRLQKLEIRDSPFGDQALHSGLHHFYNMRFLWMSSCKATISGCSEVARQMPQLRVEVLRLDADEDDETNSCVETLYMYRSLEGPRTDAPLFVKIL